MARLIETDLQRIRIRIQQIGALVLRQLQLGEQLLQQPDARTLARLRLREDHIDVLDNRIHHACHEIIALHTPVANDLRFVVAALHIGLHLEASGDQVLRIGQILPRLQPIWDVKLFAELDLVPVLQQVQRMVEAAVIGFLNSQPEPLKQVILQDAEVDEAFERMSCALIARVQQDPARSAEYILLLDVCKRLEKLGDAAVGISEEALFYIEGRQYRHKHDQLQAA